LIGFDLLPQSFTNQIIREIKSNTLHIEGLELDQGNIDIANGHFGESRTINSETQWKENLIRFYNKIIS